MTKKEKFLKFWNDRIANENEPYRYIVLNMRCTKGGADFDEKLVIGCECWRFRRDDIMNMFNDELEASENWRLESYFACSETDYENIEFYTIVKPKEKKEKEVSEIENIMLKFKELILCDDDIVCTEQSCPLWEKCVSISETGFVDLCAESEENFLKAIRGLDKHE